MSIFGQGMFTIDPNATPEQLARKREMLAMMMPRFGSARYVGEGIGQAATGFAIGRMNRNVEKTETNARQAATDRFNAAFTGRAQPGGFTVLGPTPVDPVDPNSPQGIAGDTMKALGKTPDFGALEAKYGLPAGYLERTAMIESGGDPNAQNPNSSAGGMFQFIDSTAKQYGLTDKTDPFASADAAARLAADNRAYLVKALGREPTAGELYLAHQQGAGGAAKLLAAGNAPAASVVGADAAGLNGGAGMTAADFAGKWTGKFGETVQPAGLDLGSLYALAADPWLGPEQKAAVAALIEQQTQAMDPLRNLEIQKGQLELEALRNPTPKDTRTDDMREYEYARSQGYPGTFQDFMTDMKKAGASTQTVNVGGEGGPKAEIGTIPQGFVAIPDPNSPAGYTMLAIPGGPEDMTAKNAAAASNAAVASDIVTTAAERALEAAKNRNFGAAGTTFAGMLPWTDSAEVVGQTDVLKSQASLENLTAMREASPTGGALGSVTERELKILEDKSGRLNPNSPNFERDLADYTRQLLRTIHGDTAGDEIFRQTWKGSMPDNIPAPAGAPPSDAGGWQTINGVRVREKR